eukprot:snap_masked-scaffold_11-processed-gene-4.16-mRNA-1 protein AED:1.00 eAED:1.00 QI:0/0/0/0/1/1/2/0/126
MFSQEQTRRDTRSWSDLEKILLVGNVYDQLYRSPHLNTAAWENILIGFHSDCREFGELNGLNRPVSAIRRYFKTLRTVGNYNFEAMYYQWVDLKKTFVEEKPIEEYDVDIPVGTYSDEYYSDCINI